jgi:adenylate kinase
VLRQRLTAYRAQTAPLVAYYKQQGMLRTINGMAPIPEVTAAIDRVLPVEPPAARSGGEADSVKKKRPRKSVKPRRVRSLGKKSAKGQSGPRKAAPAHKSAARKSKSGDTARP